MSNPVLEFFRARSPGLKDVGDDELTQFITEQHPEFLQDKSFSERSSLVSEKQKVVAEGEKLTGGVGVKDVLQATVEPFVPIPKPESKPTDPALQQIATGLTRAGINILEGVETPAAVGTIAAAGLGPAGRLISRGAAVGFGGFGVKQATDQILDAWNRKDLSALAEGIGNMITSGSVLAGGMGAIKPTVPGRGPAYGPNNVSPLTDVAKAKVGAETTGQRLIPEQLTAKEEFKLPDVQPPTEPKLLPLTTAIEVPEGTSFLSREAAEANVHHLALPSGYIDTLVGTIKPEIEPPAPLEQAAPITEELRAAAQIREPTVQPQEAVPAGYEPASTDLRQLQKRLRVQQISTAENWRDKVDLWADSVIEESQKRLNVGLDPEAMAAYAAKGALMMEKGVTNLRDWQIEMMKKYGVEIRPYLNNIYSESQQYYKQKGGDLNAQTIRSDQGQMPEQRGVSQGVQDQGSQDIQRAAPQQPQPLEQRAPEEAVKVAEPTPTETPPVFAGATQIDLSREPPRFVNVGQILNLPGIERLDTARRGIVELIEKRPTSQEIAATFDAASNEAAISGRQAASKARLVIGNNPLDRQALTPVSQAGDKSAMKLDMETVVKSKAPQNLKDVYRYAYANYDRLSQAVPTIESIHTDQLNSERAAGLDVDSVDNYVAQRWDFDVMLGKNKPVILDATGGKGLASFFRKQRVFDTYAEGIASGYIPKTLDITDLIDHRVRAGQNMINKKAWAQSLRQVNSPLDGNPIVTDLKRQPKGTLVAPQGYVYMDLFGQPLAVNESFAPIIKALTGSSMVPRSVVRTVAGIKHGLLFFDLFHNSRLMQMGAAANRGLPTHRAGLSVLEYSNADLNTAVSRGEITQEMADYSRLYRPVLEAGVKAGLNVGRISDALYKDVTQSIPIIGKPVSKYNKYLFDKLQRGLMAETYINWRGSNAEDFPELSARELDFKTANEVNTFYRSLGSQGVFKSQTWKDIMRTVALAPQWVEGGVATELRSLGQAGKIPIDLFTKQTFRIGQLAKTMGTGLFAYLAITQIVNLASRGKPTWENPEKNHQLDAFVPDFLSGSGGYWMSPLTVFGETAHDWIRYEDKETSQLGIAARIIGNKLHPVIHAGRDLFLGRDFFGKPLPTDVERIKQAAYDVMPEPIPAKALHSQYKGQAERTLLSTAGIKVEPVATASRQIMDLAQSFNREHGIKVDQEYHTSDYAKLKSYLRDGNMTKAQEELDTLKKTKSNKTIQTYFSHLATHPYTGSRAREHQFQQSLSRDQLELYNQARQENQNIKRRFTELK